MTWWWNPSSPSSGAQSMFVANVGDVVSWSSRSNQSDDVQTLLSIAFREASLSLRVEYLRARQHFQRALFCSCARISSRYCSHTREAASAPSMTRRRPSPETERLATSRRCNGVRCALKTGTRWLMTMGGKETVARVTLINYTIRKITVLVVHNFLQERRKFPFISHEARIFEINLPDLYRLKFIM